jgi:hypothetical protein
MGRIKNMGTSTMRFKEGIIITGSAHNPSGTDSAYALIVSGSAYVDEDIKLKGKLDITTTDVNNDVAIAIGGGNNDTVAMRFGNTADAFGFNLIYSGSGSGNENTFLISSDGGNNAPNVDILEMDQSGSVKFNEGVTILGSANSDFPSLVVSGSQVISGSGGNIGLGVVINQSNVFAATIKNDQSTNGHVLKLTTDGNNKNSTLLSVEGASEGEFMIIRGDGRVGLGKTSALENSRLVISGADDNQSDIAISHKLQHLGDSDTYLGFPGIDKMSLYAGSLNFITLEENASTQDVLYINQGEQDIDFVVSGQNEINLIKTDAQNDSVAFGTATPEAGYRVHISGSLATYLLIGEGSGGQKSTAAAATVFHANRGNESVTGSVGVTSPAGGIGKFVIGSESSHDLEVRTGGVTRLFCSASGGVGVGMNSPNEALTINGTLSIVESGVTPNADSGYGKVYVKSSDSKLYFRNDGGTEYDLTLGASNVAGSDGKLQYNNGGSMGGANALTFDDVNNRLGINQSSPQYSLDVAGSARFLSGDIIVNQNTNFLNSSDNDNTFLTPNLGGVGSNSYSTALLNTGINDLLLSSSVDIKIDASGPGVSTGKIHFDETGNNRAYLELGQIPRFHSMNHLTMSANNDIYLDADGGQIYMANGEVNYFTFNLDSTPQIDVLGDLLIDGSGDIVIDSADDFIIKNSTVQRIQVEDLTGDVAIGLHDPAYRLDVRDTVDSGFVANFENDSNDDDADVLRLKISNPGNLTTNNSFIDLLDGDNDVNGRIRGNGSGGITYSSAFTGQHPTSIASLTNVTTGMIVDSTGEIWSKYEENMETGIPKVSVTNSQNSKRVFGVIANLSGSFEGMVKASNQTAGETHIEVNSIGEGLVWVTDINGNIENGDYITSSPIFGIGQKQSDDILRSCTVAKCTEQIDWSSVSDSITHNGVAYKKYLSMCTYHCG